MKFINPDDIDVSRISVDPIDDEIKSQQQLNGYMRYKYEEDEKPTRFTIVTEPIEFNRGGIPEVGGEYRKTDYDCLYLWLNLDTCEGGKNLMNMLNKIDEYFNNEITELDNTNNLIKFKKSSKPANAFKYITTVREFDPSSVQSENARDSEPYSRVKLGIWTKFDTEASSKEERQKKPPEILTKGYKLNKHGEAVEVSINTLKDLKELYGYKCKAQFQIEASKFWISKTANQNDNHKPKRRDCGIRFKILQICITKESELSKQKSVLSSRVFGKAVVPKTSSKKPAEEPTNENNDEPDEESKSVSEHSTKTQEDSDNEDEKKSEPESEAETESEEEKKESDKGSDSDSDSSSSSSSSSDSDKKTTKKKQQKKTLKKN